MDDAAIRRWAIELCWEDRELLTFEEMLEDAAKLVAFVVHGIAVNIKASAIPPRVRKKTVISPEERAVRSARMKALHAAGHVGFRSSFDVERVNLLLSEGQSVKETARLVGIPLQTLYAAIYRGTVKRPNGAAI